MTSSHGEKALAEASMSPVSSHPSIKNVWKFSVEQEFAHISSLLDKGYTYVAMDTEFPGIVYNYNSIERSPEVGYRMLKQNVDSLKLIQIGVTLANERGEKPRDFHTWQFNLRFNIESDKHNPDSIAILRDAGINFEMMGDYGIDPMVFGDLLATSGLVINDEITWITFHGTYDFAYLIKVLINEALPSNSEDFNKYLKHCFPCIYDVKSIINDIDEWKALSLSKLGQELGLKRLGMTHQAGSDALLTNDAFFNIWKTHFPNGIPNKYFNKVFGIHNDGLFINYQNELNLNTFNPVYSYNHQYANTFNYFLPDQYILDPYFQTQGRIDPRYYGDPNRGTGMMYPGMNQRM